MDQAAFSSVGRASVAQDFFIGLRNFLCLTDLMGLEEKVAAHIQIDWARKIIARALNVSEDSVHIQIGM